MVQTFGLPATWNNSLCGREGPRCHVIRLHDGGHDTATAGVTLDEGPVFGALQMWYFQQLTEPRSELLKMSPSNYWTRVTNLSSRRALRDASAQLQHLDAVLITEHMDVSICLLYFKANFMSQFDLECRPGERKRAGAQTPVRTRSTWIAAPLLPTPTRWSASSSYTDLAWRSSANRSLKWSA